MRISDSPSSPILEINTFGMCSDVTDDATAPKACKERREGKEGRFLKHFLRLNNQNKQ
jgi:hypothetical protein